MLLLLLLLLLFFRSVTWLLLRLQGRKSEEQRNQRLVAEFNQFRHEAEKRLSEKDEEIESIR